MTRSMMQTRTSPRPLTWPPIVSQIRAYFAAEHTSTPIYLVGGTVRDACLGRPMHDIDLATPNDGLKIARGLANALDGAFYPLDKARDVGRIIMKETNAPALMIDVARFRTAADATPLFSLTEDLCARDFTINAMAVDIRGDLQQIIDPTGGLDDLIAKRLRICMPDAIARDPTRALRAVRQSAQFGLHMDKASRAAIRRDGTQLTRVSAERLRDEFMNLLGGPRPAGALRVLDALGLIDLIVPEVGAMRAQTQSLPHTYTLWEHVLAVVDRLDAVLGIIEPTRTDNSAAQAGLGLVALKLTPFRADLQAHLNTRWADGRSMRALLMLAALLHDIGKPKTRTENADKRVHFFNHDLVGAQMAGERGHALRLSRAEVQRVACIVRNHMRPMMLSNAEVVTGRAVYRFFRDTGAAGVDVCLLALADFLGTARLLNDLETWEHYVGVIVHLLEGYFQKYHQVVEPVKLLTGKDIKHELGIREGPEIGRLLRLLHEAQAAGEVLNRDEALAFVIEATRHGRTYGGG